MSWWGRLKKSIGGAVEPSGLDMIIQPVSYEDAAGLAIATDEAPQELRSLVVPDPGALAELIHRELKATMGLRERRRRSLQAQLEACLETGEHVMQELQTVRPSRPVTYYSTRRIMVEPRTKYLDPRQQADSARA